MVRFIPVALLAPLLAGCTANAMETSNAQADPLSERDQRRMAALLDGKAPGDSQPCITTRPTTQSSIIGNQAILYRVGRTVYRNDLDGMCPTLTSDSTLVVQRYGSSQLCSGEILQIRDPHSGASFGSCVLGEFTPYREE
ncbi:hypothetical protein [Parasphingopyxis lamellibrachiae]|uniref:Lipoprotein n=1 Tax=Parasphingopyxis lamellibrachiae TaxID=680125 RepID=A0A3D9FHQ0_9SPHN|nr:hypothetical protein [Parasphingopyxis lamellibrachiae]RED17178.1 hypothetical protein DFR46_2217 [Parasphingopyxis lamellibrachiae]